MSSRPCCARSRRRRAAGKPVGVNAFVPDDAERYLAAGASFVAVGADVAILARASEAPRRPLHPSGCPGTPTLPEAPTRRSRKLLDTVWR